MSYLKNLSEILIYAPRTKCKYDFDKGQQSPFKI